MTFEVKDSGERDEYASGFKRDTADNKINYTLIPPALISRLAAHLSKGAKKYGRHNWKLADTTEEVDRFEQSAWRHFMAYFNGDRDEDHLCAVIFNLMAFEWHTYGLDEEDLINL